MRPMRIVLSILTAAVLAFSLGTIVRAEQEEGLVLYLAFDEGAGKETEDLSGRGNNGSIIGGANWVQSKDGKALELDGEDDYVQVPYDEAFNITDAITIAAWVKPVLPFAPPWRAVVNNREFGAEGSYLLQTSQTNGGPERVAEFALRLGVGYTYLRAVTLLTSDEFLHVVGTYDAGNSQMRIYVNGALEENASPNQAPSGTIDPASKDGIFIGKDYGVDSPNWFVGTVDEVAIYNRALTEEEVKDLYEGKVKKRIAAVEPSDKLVTTWSSIKNQ
jgi:hypothetical protein